MKNIINSMCYPRKKTSVSFAGCSHKVMINCAGLFLLLLFTFPVLTMAQNQEILRPELKSLVKPGSKNSFLKFREGLGLTAANLFVSHRQAFGLGTNDQMVNISSKIDQYGFTNYWYHQYYKGVPVENAHFNLHMRNGMLDKGMGTIITGLNLSVTPALTEPQALGMVLDNVRASTYMWQIPGNEQSLKEIKGDPNATYYPKGKLVVYNKDGNNNAAAFRLAYRFEVYCAKPLKRLIVFIDAQNGQILSSDDILQFTDYNGTAHTMYSGVKTIKTSWSGLPIIGSYRLRETSRGDGIQTFNLKKSEDYGSAVDFTDWDNNWNYTTNDDNIALDAHWGAEMTYDYMKIVHEWDSYDDNNSALISYVHYDTLNGTGAYDNAFWDGTRMSYGDGAKWFTPLAALDVCGHEINHAVQSSQASPLVYRNESGALKEMFSDIFGTCTEKFGKGSFNWTIGEDICKIDPYLRSMSNPLANGLPDTYQVNPWEFSADDHGGVHTNCGVGNKWFYLLSQGGSAKNGKHDKYKVNGIGIDDAQKIAWRALTYYLGGNDNYSYARDATLASAEDLFNECSKQVISTLNAWYAVGVGDPFLQFDSTDVKDSYCKEDNGEIFIRVKGAKGTPEYAWSNGETTAHIDSLAPGTYTVTVTDTATTCEIDTTFVVKEKANFTDNLTKFDVTNCGGDNGWIICLTNGVNGTPEYNWSNGGTEFMIENLVKGWYYVTITDTMTECDLKDSIEIKEPEIKVAISGGGTRTICPGDPVSVTLTAVATNCNGCSYHWSTGATGQSITVSYGGAYSVLCTNAEGCTGSASTVVSIWMKDCDDDDWEIPIVAPSDPNEIIGPSGYSPEQWVARSSTMAYVVRFENDPDFATAPAQVVKVTVPFDETVNMFSLRLGSFGFGDYDFQIPANTSFYYSRLDLRDSLSIYVDLTAGIDVNNHEAFWIFESIDPITGLAPSDATRGFLLVNDSVLHRGEGYVSFTQVPKNTDVTGDSIHAQASIVFDINEAIATNTWVNLVDAVAPFSAVNALPASSSTTIPLSFSGSDDPGGTGIAAYRVYVSVNNGPFDFYREFPVDSAAVYTGSNNSTVAFFSLAKDHVGNLEPMKNAAEATTHIEEVQPTTFRVSGIVTYLNAFSTPLTNTEVYLESLTGDILGSATTDNQGNYQFNQVSPGTYRIEATTSKAWNGGNAADALAIMRHFVGTQLLSGLRLAAADVDAFPSVNAADALAIARRFIGMINVFPKGDWIFDENVVNVVNADVTYDFNGLCFGDVDGSYIPSAKLVPSLSVVQRSELDFAPGQEILVPVKSEYAAEIGSLSLILNYPGDLVEIRDVTMNDASGNGQLVYAITADQVKLAWYSLTPLHLNAGETLLNLKIMARNVADNLFVAFRAAGNSAMSDGKALVYEDALLVMPRLRIYHPVDFDLGNNQPNPFTGETTISYTLPETGKVKLAVYDVIGNKVQSLVDEIREAGSYQVIFNGSGLAKGVYFYKIDVEGITKTFSEAKRMVISR